MIPILQVVYSYSMVVEGKTKNKYYPTINIEVYYCLDDLYFNYYEITEKLM